MLVYVQQSLRTRALPVPGQKQHGTTTESQTTTFVYGK